MPEDVYSRSTFDPRRHSAVAIGVHEKLPFRGSRAEEVALKSFLVGPNVAPPSLSLRRPGSSMPRKLPDGSTDPNPKFLSPKGRWVQEEMPALIAESQSQPLTATSTLTATLPAYGSEPGRSIRPVTAVHTYADISPVVSADMVADTDLGATLIKESTLRRPYTAMASSEAPSGLKLRASAITSNLDMAITKDSKDYKNPEARQDSIDGFWSRQAGSQFNLRIKDLERCVELGKNVSAGSANCRLIGSRWRYLDRPVDGDVIYTDYYGRCGKKLNDYYGRAYHTTNLRQFSASKMVEDNAYIRVQASLAGINTLRTRPGLAMDATIVSGPAGKLEGLTVKQAQTSRGLHRHNEFARIRPGSAQMVREQGWVS